MRLQNRRSIRLRGFDYTSAGAYFVTLCTYRRRRVFGAIAGGRFAATAAGRIAEDEWRQSAVIRSEIELGPFVVMPDHFHALVIHRGVAGPSTSPPRPRLHGAALRPTGPPPASLGALIAGFKAAVTTRVNGLQETPGERLWHRNYHERIVRDDRAYRCIAAYIDRNRARWWDDRDHGR